MTRTRISTLVAGATAALALLGAGPAMADSIVYEKRPTSGSPTPTARASTR